MHFRLTARDEFTPDAAADHAGGLSSDDVALTIDPAAGPFLVTSLGGGGTVAGRVPVTWDVAGTNTAAMAKNVRISLSTDGGVTFPTVLAASTPNDGSESVPLPNSTTSTARIKVEAVGNYFFDINDANFSIAAANHLGDGKGKFKSPKRSSKRVAEAKGKAKFSFAANGGTLPSGSASFKFKKGKIAFTGDDVVTAGVIGNKLTMAVHGTNKGKTGFTLVVVAVDKGGKDRIRVRMRNADDKLVYDSMPGKRPGAKPRTRIKGHIDVV